jgi:hypothetical protein
MLVLKRPKVAGFEAPNDMWFGLQSIVGMSGCPIFAFRNENGVWRGWIAAVQSRWDKDSKTIYGCPIPLVGGFLAKWMDDMDDKYSCEKDRSEGEACLEDRNEM